MSKRTPKGRKQRPNTKFYTPPAHIATAIVKLAEAQAQRRPQRQRKF